MRQLPNVAEYGCGAFGAQVLLEQLLQGLTVRIALAQVDAVFSICAAVGLPTPHGQVCRKTKVQKAVLIVRWMARITIVFVGIQNAIAVRVFAVKELQCGSIDQPQLLHRFEGRVLCFIGLIAHQIAFGLCPIGREFIVGIAPVDDGRGELRRHFRKGLKHFQGGRVQVQFARLVFHAVADEPLRPLVLEANPLEVAPETIRDIAVWGTVFAGDKFPAPDKNP